MGIYGMMRTGVSGMNAQSTKLSGIADNVANSSTAGYKRVDTQFSSLVLPATAAGYQSGSVNAHIRHDMTTQGASRSTLRPGDIMVNGNGFYRVTDASGTEYMTRAGSFSRDAEGYLVNASGFYLLNPLGEKIQIKGYPAELFAPEVTQNLNMEMNLNAGAETIDRGTTTFSESDASTYGMKKSIDVYDQQGKIISLDVYYTKIADGNTANGTNDTWEVQIPGATPAATMSLEFDADGQLITPPGSQDITLTGGNQTDFTVSVNFVNETGTSMVTQTGDTYTFKLAADGIAPGVYNGFDFGENGEVVVSYSNGQTRTVNNVGMVTVTSPDNLKPISGTVYQYTVESGSITYGQPGDGTFGKLVTGALEESNADVATELTDMIESQRNYTANSKIFQTGSELMDVIVNMVR